MTKTNNIVCKKCGVEEKEGLIVRIENHYKNPDHSDKTVPTGYMCMHCGYSNVETNKHLKSI